MDMKKVIETARQAHYGQFRKWGEKDPYIVHPTRVAEKLATLVGVEQDDIAAAYLHDVLEDVAIKQNKVAEYEALIRDVSSETTLKLVWELTNPTEGPEWEGKSRSEKRKADWEHLAKISNRAKRIKLVDRWDNLKNAKVMPKKLLAKYLAESQILLDICKEADLKMANQLQDRIDEAKNFI